MKENHPSGGDTRVAAAPKRQARDVPIAAAPAVPGKEGHHSARGEMRQ